MKIDVIDNYPDEYPIYVRTEEFQGFCLCDIDGMKPVYPVNSWKTMCGACGGRITEYDLEDWEVANGYRESLTEDRQEELDD